MKNTKILVLVASIVASLFITSIANADPTGVPPNDNRPDAKFNSVETTEDLVVRGEILNYPTVSFYDNYSYSWSYLGQTGDYAGFMECYNELNDYSYQFINTGSQYQYKYTCGEEAKIGQNLAVVDDQAMVQLRSRGAFGPASIEFWSDHGLPAPWRPAIVRSVDNGSWTGGLAFITNGTGPGNLTSEIEAMRITNGKVGIGTSSPEESLHVSGIARIEKSNLVDLEEAHLNIERFEDGLALDHVSVDDQGDPLNEPIHIRQNGEDALLIGANNHLGIGVSGPWPDNPLTLLGNGGTQPVGITQRQVGGTATMELTTADADGDQATRLLLRGGTDPAAVEFYSGARGSESQNMIITGDGNVGIGTNAPSHKLHVKDSDSFLHVGDKHFNYSCGNMGGPCSSAIYLKDWDATLTTNGQTEWSELQLDKIGPSGYPQFNLQSKSTTRTRGIQVNDDYDLEFYASSQESGGINTNILMDPLEIKLMKDDEDSLVVTSDGVGIGTDNPGNALTVRGDGVIDVSDGNGLSGSSKISFNNRGNFGYEPGTIYMRGASGKNLKFYTNGDTTSRMTIATDGNVGIGTDSPGEKLHVEGNIFFDDNSLIAGDTGDGDNIDHIWHYDAGNAWIFNSDTTIKSYTGTSEIRAEDGNFGGDLDADGDLDVDGNATIDDAFIGDVGCGASYNGFQHNSLSKDCKNYALLAESDGDTYLNAANGKGIRFRENNGDLAVLDEYNGLYVKNSSIGTSDWSHIGYKGAGGSALLKSGNYLRGYTFMADYGGKVMIGGHDTSTFGTHKLVVHGSAAKTGGGSWSSTSDIRLKDVKSSYEYGLEELLKLKPFWYSFKYGNPYDYETNVDYAGLSAQEVQKVIPEAVIENEDGFLSIDYNKLTPAYLNAFRELNEENSLLKKELAKLSARVEALESK